MNYLFVDTSVNKVTRVTAPDLSGAWRKYIDLRIRELPTKGLSYVDRQYYEHQPPHYAEIQEDLGHDVFVLDESEVQSIL